MSMRTGAREPARVLVRRLALGLSLAVTLVLPACGNSPWESGAAGENTLYTAMQENTPRHLDPTASYWSNDTPVTYQVYEPLYGYHYFKRPYELVPKSAAKVVTPRYVSASGQPLPDDAPGELIAESIYDIPIRPGILYQPHPAFARNEQGQYRYHAMKPGELGERRSPWAFEHVGTRELVAEDFVYAIKRHATTRITAPVFGIFSEYVLGLKEYGERIKAEDTKLRAGLDPSSPDRPFLDFRRWELAGATAPEKHLLRIRLKGKYPQWKYWMQMTFFSPVPWEADAFYAQPGMAANSLSMDNWPIGTGPYMVTVWEKDRRIEMRRNPNYRGVPFPCEGPEEDRQLGRLADCGQKTPFIDRIVATVEREATPQKNKFRDGYYDVELLERTDTGVHYRVEAQDSEEVRRVYEARGMDFPQYSDVGSYFIGFNLLDPVLGGGTDAVSRERARKLRQALTIAIDWEEYSQVFPKKAGAAAMGPLPEGLPGSREGTPQGLNPVTHRMVDGKPVRRGIDEARQLMAQAGYPEGRDAVSGKPLVLNYDFYAPPTPERKPEIDWVVRQFSKLNVQLEVRATDNNQFQDKVRKGKHQVFWSGWQADYPDAENFLFLFYGPNAKSVSDGENTSNYQNAEFDRLFKEMKLLDDGPRKQAVIDQLIEILRHDAPQSFGFFPYASVAAHGWVGNMKPATLIRDSVRYLKLDIPQRQAALAAWNRPVWWPLPALLGVVLLAGWGIRRALLRRERTTGRGEVLPS
ncbi:MAG: ABC transporter substrate-binding protein [Rubrivivax sp.]|nr:ABC transporter substrate-binding protein [Rubrivivax sp.]